jgi:hypothetical protein
MKQNADTLKRGRCWVLDANQHSWCTYENFKQMYKGVYSEILKAGIAVEKEEPVMYDAEGKETSDEEKRAG